MVRDAGDGAETGFTSVGILFVSLVCLLRHLRKAFVVVMSWDQGAALGIGKHQTGNLFSHKERKKGRRSNRGSSARL